MEKPKMGRWEDGRREFELRGSMTDNFKRRHYLADSISRSGRGDKEELPQAYNQYVEENDDAGNEVMSAKASQR